MLFKKIIFASFLCSLPLFYGIMPHDCAAAEQKKQQHVHVDVVTAISNEIIAVKKAKLQANESKRRFIEIANKYVSLKGIAKFLLGAKFRTLGAKKDKFVHCVTNLIATRLLAELPHGDSIKTVITDFKNVSEQHSLVTAEYTVNEQKYKIVFSIFDTNDGPKVFDIILNDVSASQIQRADIYGKIAKDGFDKFLVDFFKMYE